ncbi:MAG: NUDIX domain-containing protein [Candidatus Bathyarchaeota archaeon]|nr:NUDIX domain-containing protein [Candidatus Bathyarchaeota archaeon]
MTERFIRVGTRAVIFNRDNKILVAHCLNPEHNFYFLPGGGVWFQEKIEDCLVREVKEETELDVKAERLLWVRDVLLPDFPNQHGIEMFFLATITGGKLRAHPIHDGGEPLEFSFIDVEKLERIRFYPTSFVAKLKKLRDDRNWSEKNPYTKSAP